MMFLSWLRRLLGSRRHRLIFRYHNGHRTVSGDPILIDKALRAACPDLPALTLLLKPLPADLPGGVPEAFRKQAEENAEKALDRIAGAVREAFGVKPLDMDGNGLTQAECLDLLADFQEFAAALAESARPLSKPPAPSDSPEPAVITASPAGATSCAMKSTTASPV